MRPFYPALKQLILIAVLIYIAWVMCFSYYSFQQEKEQLYSTLDQQLETPAPTAALLPDSLHHQNIIKDETAMKHYSSANYDAANSYFKQLRVAFDQLILL